MIRLPLLLLSMLLVLTACGSGSATDASSQSPLPTKKIDITFSNNTVTPNGDRITVKVGQPLQFVVSADAPGEIHVHAEPEEELSYNQGTTILEVGPFSTPGIIEVESHDLGKTILQLQVQ